jgi:YD repeat-containing protein
VSNTQFTGHAYHGLAAICTQNSVTDERGVATAYVYRAYGNPDQQFLIYISAPVADAHVSITRNSKDLVTSVAQGGAAGWPYARGYGYNANYYLTTETNPETGTTIYGRDAAGNMTSKQVGTSGTTSYTYDGQNRLTSVVYPGDTPSVTNTYNKTNRLLSSNSLVANRTYAYDANNNLSSEALAIDGKSYAVGYAYNGNDQLSAMAYPNSGSAIYYAPDVLGRPTQVSGYVTGITYWQSGQINQINYANGTVTKYDQNSRLWPSSFSTQKSGTNLNNNSYTYDGVGNLKTVTDYADSSYNRYLDYDGINRLTTSYGSWGAGSISYNGVGNITSQVFGGSSLSYVYDGSNRLSSVSGTKTANYGYDANGNIISGGGNSYTYDGAPNLRCINCSNPTSSVQYQYDGTNHRVSETKVGVKTHEFVDSQGKQLLSTVSQGDYLDATEFFYLGGKRVAQRKLFSFRHTITSLTTDTSNVYQNQSVTLIATVSGSNPPGTVTFYKGNQILGTATVINGQARLTIKFDTLGNTSITATYSDEIIKTTNTQSPALNFIVTVAPDLSWLIPIITLLLSD